MYRRVKLKRSSTSLGHIFNFTIFRFMQVRSWPFHHTNRLRRVSHGKKDAVTNPAVHTRIFV